MLRRLYFMAKTVSFIDTGKDKDLVKRIESYQKQKKTTFIEAVRQLWDKGLTVEKLKK
jgi:hypothetical protein